MTYFQFWEQWHKVGCFNIYQVRAAYPRFDRGNPAEALKKEWFFVQKNGLVSQLFVRKNGLKVNYSFRKMGRMVVFSFGKVYFCSENLFEKC